MKAVIISCFTEEGPEGQRSKETDLRSHSKLRVNIKPMFSTPMIIIARSAEEVLWRVAVAWSILRQ